MNKKAVMATIALVVVMMLPTLAPVLAAPKEKVDFALYIQGSTPSSTWLHDHGYLVVSPDEKWSDSWVPPPEGPAVYHYINMPFILTKVWLVLDGETIPYTRLDYTAAISGDRNRLTMMVDWKADETVTIYTDSSKTIVLGSLEMRTVSRGPYIPTLDVVVGTFEGHGTGALEGVKVKGDTYSTMILGVPTRVRDGIAMDWPQ